MHKTLMKDKKQLQWDKIQKYCNPIQRILMLAIKYHRDDHRFTTIKFGMNLQVVTSSNFP